MTISELIQLLRAWERELGTDAYVSIADFEGVIGDVAAVGYDDKTGDLIISPV